MNREHGQQEPGGPSHQSGQQDQGKSKKSR